MFYLRQKSALVVTPWLGALDRLPCRRGHHACPSIQRGIELHFCMSGSKVMASCTGAIVCKHQTRNSGLTIDVNWCVTDHFGACSSSHKTLRHLLRSFFKGPGGARGQLYDVEIRVVLIYSNCSKHLVCLWARWLARCRLAYGRRCSQAPSALLRP